MPKQSPGDPRKFAIGDKIHAAQGDCDGEYGDADGENIMGVWKDCTIISSSTAFPIDFHAPSPTEAEGAYFFLPREERPKASRTAAQKAVKGIAPALPKALLHVQPTRQVAYPSRWDATATLDAHIWDQFKIPCLALEIPYTSSHHTLLTREQYRRFGATLLEGICAHL
ncbi:hypothetical protein OAF45_03420, partial [Candidatus Latescibacteria bacterium]|nr:hypothetical protein [Candidatus Latescibacterota bacterium]